MGYNKVSLYGKQVCDYLYIQDSEVDINQFSSVNSEPQNWNNSTLLFAKFNNDLVAGESSLTDSIAGYEVRRQKGTSSHTEKIGTIKAEAGANPKKHMIDYMAASNTYYTYYLYPASEKSETGAVLLPFISEDIKPEWGYWSLMVVDESDDENIFYLDKLFKFELNLTTDDMGNNTVSTVTQNFTRYPTIQHGMSNYWTSSLSALCGFISCNDVDYIQTPNMINELKDLCSDSRRKFLKDIDGNVWEIDITAPISISTEDNTLERAKTIKVTWTEIGDASGISIINNPNKSTTNWILTETGEVVPYIEYIWDEHYKWDKSYKWTIKERKLTTDASNLGRALFEKGDE